jgi:hypothetical protein
MKTIQPTTGAASFINYKRKCIRNYDRNTSNQHTPVFRKYNLEPRIPNAYNTAQKTLT